MAEHQIGTKLNEEDDKLLNQLQEWLNEAEQSTEFLEWQLVAEEDYRFYAGDQDTKAVKIELTAQKRATTVYNQIKPKIDAMIGIGSDLRISSAVKPIENTDKLIAEIFGEIYTFKQLELMVTDVESECLAHMIKSGRSLQRWFVDSSNPFVQKPKTERVESMHFLLDGQGRKYDLSDHRYIHVDKWMTENEIKAFFPGFDAETVKSFASQQTVNRSFSASEQSPANTRTGNFPEFWNEDSKKFRIVETWYREFVRVTWFINPMTGKPDFLLKKDFSKFQKAIKEGIPNSQGGKFQFDGEISGIERPMKLIKFAFWSGNIMMENGDTPFTGYNKDHFPFTFYGAYKNDITNQWFSAITTMKDPQRGFNTTLRQLVHLLQTLPKGMPVFEEDAVINLDEFKEKSSDPRFVLEVKRGVIGQKRIDFIQQPSISPVYERLLDLFNKLMKDLSNVQDPLLAIQTTGREPGITAQMRQQSNIVALFTLFDNYRKSKIHGGRQLLAFIQQFISEEEVLRILTPELAKQIAANPQVIKDLSLTKFDLFVDESMESKTMRLATAKVLTEFNNTSPGIIPPSVIMEYTDMPATVLERVREAGDAQAESEKLKEDREFFIELTKLEVKLDMQNKDIAKEIKIEKDKLAVAKQTATANRNGKEKK